jgi:hypothetical protein
LFAQTTASKLADKLPRRKSSRNILQKNLLVGAR